MSDKNYWGSPWWDVNEAPRLEGMPSPRVTYYGHVSAEVLAADARRDDEQRRKWREAKRRQRAAKKGVA